MRTVLNLPFPPTINHYWIHTSKRIVLSTKGRKYKNEVVNIVLENGKPSFGDRSVKVQIKLFPQDNRRRDLDNFAGKALLDALTSAGLWKDDSQVKELHLLWGSVLKPNGKAEVSIEDLD